MSITCLLPSKSVCRACLVPKPHVNEHPRSRHLLPLVRRHLDPGLNAGYGACGRPEWYHRLTPYLPIYSAVSVIERI